MALLWYSAGFKWTKGQKKEEKMLAGNSSGYVENNTDTGGAFVLPNNLSECVCYFNDYQPISWVDNDVFPFTAHDSSN